MMFLQYAAMGALAPVMSLYLKDHLGFAPEEVGLILAMPAVAAFASPFITARVADRLVSAERVLALYHLLAAGAMAALCFQDRLVPVMLLFLLFALLFSPTSTLCNSVAFHHIPEARRNFGAVRLWGTIGWIAVAWIFGYGWLRGLGAEPAADRLPHALPATAICCVVMAAFVFTFPRRPAEKNQKPPTIRGALAVLRQPALALFCVLTFISAITNTFYMQWSGPFISQHGIAQEFIMPALSLGQVMEIPAMFFVGRFLERFGFKTVMAVGLGAQVLRCALFAFTPETSAILVGIGLHGVSWTFFFTAGYIYIDQHSPARSRAAVLLFFTMTFACFGKLAGNLLAGRIAGALLDSATNEINFTAFWIVPMVLSAIVLVAHVIFFKERLDT
jgi:nucleoside transporter